MVLKATSNTGGGGGVSSLNGVSGAAILVGSNGVGVNVSGQNIDLTLTEIINAGDYGLVSDRVVVSDATLSLSTPTTVTSASGGFATAVVGQTISVSSIGTGGLPMIGLISAVASSTSITVNWASNNIGLSPPTTPVNAVSGASCEFGTDNHGALNAAVAAVVASGNVGILNLPKGKFLCNAPSGIVISTVGLQIIGSGRGSANGTILSQVNYGVPLFKLTADGIDFQRVNFQSSQAKVSCSLASASTGVNFGSAIHIAGANFCNIENIFVQGFVTGIKLIGNSSLTGNPAVDNNFGNRIANYRADSVDFGVLYQKQSYFTLIDFKVTNINYSQTPNATTGAGATPPHAFYGDGNQPSPYVPPFTRSYGIIISNGYCSNNPYSSAFKSKFVTGAAYSNLVADTCERGFDMEDIDSATWTNCSITNVCQPYASSNSTPAPGADSGQAGFNFLDCDDGTVTGCFADVSNVDNCPGFWSRYTLTSRDLVPVAQGIDLSFVNCRVLASYTAANYTTNSSDPGNPQASGYLATGTTRTSWRSCSFTTQSTPVTKQGTSLSQFIVNSASGTGATITIPTTTLGTGGTLTIGNGDSAATVQTNLQAIAAVGTNVTVALVTGTTYTYKLTYSGPFGAVFGTVAIPQISTSTTGWACYATLADSGQPAFACSTGGPSSVTGCTDLVLENPFVTGTNHVMQVDYSGITSGNRSLHTHTILNLDLFPGISFSTSMYQDFGSASRYSQTSVAINSLTVNSATPSIIGSNIFKTANTSATTLTNFTGGKSGQTMILQGGDSGFTTIAPGGANIIVGKLWTSSTKNAIWFEYDGTYWREVGRTGEDVIYANGNSGTSFALNKDNGPYQTISVTGAVAMTQTTPTYPGRYTLIVKQDATGHVYSLSSIKWAGGTPPAYSTAANKIDMFDITWDGTNYYGSAVAIALA